jgi:hypothetical protein
MSGDADLYVIARRILLDALAALGVQRQAVILIGAQAIYLHTGEGDLAVAVFTSDADIAIDPSALATEPVLASALESGDFEHTAEVGMWKSADLPRRFRS